MPLALIVEEFACASMLLRTIGYAAEAYHPHAVCASVTRPITAAIRHGRFLLVWIEIPRSARSVPIGKRTATYVEMAQWFRTARLSGTQAVMIGLRGHAWQDPSLAALVNEGLIQESDHQLCAFGITIYGDSPSKV